MDKFTKACLGYEVFVRQAYWRHVKLLGYGYVAVPNAPETLDALDKAVRMSILSCAPFPVWEGGSERTVFSLPASNYMFRFLHDHEHVRQRLDVNTADEILLGEQWTDRVFAATQDVGVARIAMIDTIGQTLHHSKHGEFPTNQRAFARELFYKLEN